MVWSREDGQPLELRAVTDREQNLHIYSALARHRRITNKALWNFKSKIASQVLYETGSSELSESGTGFGTNLKLRTCQIFTKKLLEIERETALEKYNIASCNIKSN